MPNYVKLLQLEGHKEGGYFSLVYKSSDKVMPVNTRYMQNNGDATLAERHAGSLIYFLLEQQGFSAWHRLKSDEIWHYYDGGSPIDLHVIHHDGKLATYTLGNPAVTEDASFQVIIPAETWFAAEIRDKSSYGLAGCTVSPAFEYEDFELAELYQEQLVKQYPHLSSIINKFIKPNVIKSNENIVDHGISAARNKFSAEDYIQKYKLVKHPEGGYFSVNYASADSVTSLDPRYKNKLDEKSSSQESDSIHRLAGTSIYFLLEKSDFSAWHKVKSDEIWHYYDGGSPVDIHIIDKQGNIKTFILGNPLLTANASFQVVIKAGEWFAAEVKEKTSFALVGCTVSPGFEYIDFTLADRKKLTSEYPVHEAIIKRLTKTSPTNIDTIGLYANSPKKLEETTPHIDHAAARPAI